MHVCAGAAAAIVAADIRAGAAGSGRAQRCAIRCAQYNWSLSDSQKRRFALSHPDGDEGNNVSSMQQLPLTVVLSLEGCSILLCCCVCAVFNQHLLGADARCARSCGDQPQCVACKAPAHPEVIDLVHDDDEEEQACDISGEAAPEEHRVPREGAGALRWAGQAADEFTGSGPPWWTILPDFVPVAALRDGRDPRRAS